MTRHEITAAYLQGRMDRRQFIVRLTALGFSAAAAVAYADSLSAAPGQNVVGTRTAFIPSFQDDDDVYGGPVSPGSGGTGGTGSGGTGGTGSTGGTGGTGNVSSLPATGAGSQSGGSQLLKPVTVAAAGVAALTARFLRRKSAEVE